MANEFKKCPNGHYYQGNECPYCRSHPSAGKDSITIGRNTENDLIVNNNAVADVHCRIERIGEERYRITDLQSENGTYVNGQRLNGSMEIGPFDVIKVGDTNVQWLHQFAAPDRSYTPLSGEIIESEEDYLSNDSNHKESSEGKESVTQKAQTPQWEYHQCPNGHYYKGNGPCPFCPSTKPPKEEKEDNKLKVCRNLHAYDANLNKCPICESSIVVDEITWDGSETVKTEFIEFDRPVLIKMEDKDPLECKGIGVLSPMRYSCKLCYSASSPYERMSVEIIPNMTVSIDDTTMSGRELIRLCDLILDNRKELSSSKASYVDVRVDDLIQLNDLIKRVTSEHVNFSDNDSLKTTNEFKKCPNGHYYQGDNCPFCGEASIGSSSESGPYVYKGPLCPYCGKTIAVIDCGVNSRIEYLWYGKCRSCQHDFIVDYEVVNYFPKLVCPHCGKQVTNNNYKKWNGVCENCGHNFATDWNIFKEIEKGCRNLMIAKDRAQSFMLHHDLAMQAKKDCSDKK